VTRRRGVAGQATPLLLVVIALASVASLAFVELGSEGVQRGRLQAVADVTALAAAHDVAAAADVAAANSATVVSVHEDADGVVTVVVERGDRRAVAAATA